MKQHAWERKNQSVLRCADIGCGEEMPERECRDTTRARGGGGCEVRVAGVCLGRATNFQHRLAKGHGGLYVPSNGLDVCGWGNYSGCHGYIHQNPTIAVEKGWTVESWDDPWFKAAEVWMQGHTLRSVFLDDLGDFDYHRERAAAIATALEAS